MTGGPAGGAVVRTVDYHTGGEPFRIVPEPPVPLPGAGVGDRRVRAIDSAEAQALRRLLCFEPRGHADMYGGFIVPPDDDGAAFGVLFWHKDGFSTACGHGTIALGAWAIEQGVVASDPSGITDVVIDVPSGRVTARVRSAGRRVHSVEFVSVPSFATALDVVVPTSWGDVAVDVGFGGAIYAQLGIGRLPLAIAPERADALIALGREVKHAVEDTALARFAADPRLDGVYGTILFEDFGLGPSGALRQRNVTVFADGQLDRSPCGSGTAARVAVLHARGVLRAGGVLEHRSIVGSTFTARFDAIADDPSGGAFPVVLPTVTGTAHLTGTHEFVTDPDDELVPGFVFR